MNKKFTLEELEAYLFGELEDSKKEELEKELETSPELQNDLDAIKISGEAIEMAGWKQVIAQAHQQFQQEESDQRMTINPSKTTSFYYVLFKVAASLVILLVAGASIYVGTLTTEQITANRIDYVVPVMRSGEIDESKLKEAFTQGDFKQVIELSNQSTELNEELQFFTALAYLNLKNYDQAIEQFKILQGTSFSDPADYYLAHSYVEQGNLAQAEQVIKAIRANPSHAYHNNFSSLDLWNIRLLKWKE